MDQKRNVKRGGKTTSTNHITERMKRGVDNLRRATERCKNRNQSGEQETHFDSNAFHNFLNSKVK